MGLTPDAIISLVALLVTCFQSILLVMTWLTRRRTRLQGTGWVLEFVDYDEASDSPNQIMNSKDSQTSSMYTTRHKQSLGRDWW